MKEIKEPKQHEGGTLVRPQEDAFLTWNPWSEVAEIRRRMDDLFARPFGYTPLARLLPPETSATEPEVDVHETEEAIQVLASLPGYTIDQIDVQATESSFTIQGKREALLDKEKVQTHRNAGLSESSQFYFTYTLPVAIDTKRIKATFANGVLQIELPKTESARVKSVKINVKPA